MPLTDPIGWPWLRTAEATRVINQLWPDPYDDLAIRIRNEAIILRHVNELLMQDTIPAWLKAPIDPRRI